MAIDPRTPVIVGVGQVLHHPDKVSGPEDLVEPLDLMVDALRRAAEDIDGVAEGAPSPLGTRLLSNIDRLTSVVSFTWRTANPSLLVAERLGIHPGDLAVTATGGCMPQKLVADAATAILNGDADVVGVVGSEAMFSRGASRKSGLGDVQWTLQDPETTPPARVFGTETMPLTPLEIERSILLPIQIYPLFENARRARNAWTIDEHRQKIGNLWSSFSEVATANPSAWMREPHSSEEIITASPSNRMIAEPYTKMMVANLPVDMGAAFLMCSYETARSLGIRDDALVFPQSHAHANDHFFISERPELDRSVAIKAAGDRAFELAGASIDDVAHIDLYSCFPIAVALGAEALGLDLEDRTRPLTLTGGLTFGGGPGNNYVGHSIATMVQRLREHPGDLGLLTGLSYFATTHAVGLYSTTPPSTSFQSADVQSVVDAEPIQRVARELEGTVRVETYTVVHDRDNGPEKIIAAVRDQFETRSWVCITDEASIRDLAGTELCGLTGVLTNDGSLILD